MKDHEHTPPAFVLRFHRLFGNGPALSFACDRAGSVDLDSLRERALRLLLCPRRDRTGIRNAAFSAQGTRMNTPRTDGVRQSSTAGIPARHAHAFAAVAATCLLSLASALFLALGAPDDPPDGGTGGVRGAKVALHR